ncbi:hypothetical protein HJ091_19845 [Vibrio parahaemolyticus]|nr:hypothetical protein [Vibrio parahaemolyticus]MBE4190966.1 hypothetical protein [Vibrio parahaemolyticus]
MAFLVCVYFSVEVLCRGLVIACFGRYTIKEKNEA